MDMQPAQALIQVLHKTTLLTSLYFGKRSLAATQLTIATQNDGSHQIHSVPLWSAKSAYGFGSLLECDQCRLRLGVDFRVSSQCKSDLESLAIIDCVELP